MPAPKLTVEAAVEEAIGPAEDYAHSCRASLALVRSGLVPDGS